LALGEPALHWEHQAELYATYDLYPVIHDKLANQRRVDR
jgi:hypothetical protein